jgi:hypothetical protein
MSLGSDYAAGYNLGLDTNSSYSGGGSGGGNSAMDLYKATLAAHQPMSGQIVHATTPSASEMAVKAAKDALEIKEKELALREKEQGMREAELTGAYTRSKMAEEEKGLAQNRDIGLRTQSEKERTAAEGRVDKARGLVTEEAAQTKADRLKGVMAGIYVGDFAPVMDYFKTYGREGVQFDKIEAGKNGGVSAIFNGKQVNFNSPQDFINQVIAPAEALQRQNEQKEMALKEREVASKETTAAATAEKERGMAEYYKSGGAGQVTDKVLRANKASLTAKALTAWNIKAKAAEEEGAPLTDADKAAFLVDYVDAGLNTIEQAGTAGGGLPTEVAPETTGGVLPVPSQPQYTEDEIRTMAKQNGLSDEATEKYIADAKASGLI